MAITLRNKALLGTVCTVQVDVIVENQQMKAQGRSEELLKSARTLDCSVQEMAPEPGYVKGTGDRGKLLSSLRRHMHFTPTNLG